MPYVARTSGRTAKDDYIIHTYFYPDGFCKGWQTLGVLGKEGAFDPEGKGKRAN